MTRSLTALLTTFTSLITTQAFAAVTTHPAVTLPGHGALSMMPMLAAFGMLFYFMLIRPQNKRTKQHQTLLNNLTKGDEIVTNGGLLGKIVKICDDFIILNIAKNTDIIVQKQTISTAMPKGTLKTVK